MNINEQIQISELVLAVTEKFGFALAGGFALNVQGIIERPTKDIDTFTSDFDEVNFRKAREGAEQKLKDAGYIVTVKLDESWRCSMLVTNPTTKDSVELELAYYHRYKEVALVEGIGPVLDVYDLAAGKIVALWDRQFARDYIDVAAFIAKGIYSIQDLYDMLKEARPEASLNEFLACLLQVNQWHKRYAEYEMSESEIDDLVKIFHDAASSLGAATQ